MRLRLTVALRQRIIGHYDSDQIVKCSRFESGRANLVPCAGIRHDNQLGSIQHQLICRESKLAVSADHGAYSRFSCSAFQSADIE